jgi:hypothetical protein
MTEAPRDEPFLRFNPHWFRRAVHAMGGALILYYLLPPGDPVAGPIRRYLPAVAFAAGAAVEGFRMAGGIKSEHFFGLREYERSRVSGYIYFGAATVLLLYFFPQAIAVPSIVGAAIGDPIVGEVRDRYGMGPGLATGTAFGAFLYALLGWGGLVAVAAGAIMAVAESTRFRLLDDDLLMPMVPALVLLGLHLAGYLAVPEPLIQPMGVPWP